LYLVWTYVVLIAILAATVWFYEQRAALGLAWAWNVPVTLLAVILIGASQHQLAGLAHDASHHIMLRHRRLNELVSDWFCMFPLFSTTHHYRLQHLAHHQFVNDPVRDPNLVQMQVNGDWTHFPLQRGELWRSLLRQLWVPNLIKYIR